MTNMAEDLKAPDLEDGVPSRVGAITPEDRRRSQRKRTTREQQKRTTNAVIYGVLAVLVVALMVPFIWMVSSSLKETTRSSPSPSSGSPRNSCGATTRTSGPGSP